MKKWEYKIEKWAVGAQSDKLRDLGKDGWELFFVLEERNNVVLYLKRPVEKD